jgi:uncharacterized protein
MRSNRLGLAMALVGGFACAQSGPSGTQPASVRATGEGVIYAKPDQARIDIAVVTDAPTAQAAGAQNAARSQAVLDELRKQLGSKADIRTMSYSLNPDYQYPKNGGKPTINGYSAVNTVEAVIDDLSAIGKLIDEVTVSGANRIQGVRFELKDDKAVRGEALKKAAQEARSNVESMAAALGLKLGRVLSMEQQGGTPLPVRPMMMTNQVVVATPTPVEAQPVEVRASVTLTVEIAGQPR